MIVIIISGDYCTTKTAILSGGEQVVPFDRRVEVGPGVGHGQAVVRVGHRAQALLQLVALAALRPRPPDRLRRTADAAPDAADAAVKASAGTTAKSSADGSSEAAASAAAADASAAAVRRRQRRAEREMARGRRRFGGQSRRQAHAVYLNQRRVFILPHAHALTRYTHTYTHRGHVTDSYWETLETTIPPPDSARLLLLLPDPPPLLAPRERDRCAVDRRPTSAKRLSNDVDFKTRISSTGCFLRGTEKTLSHRFLFGDDKSM